MDNGKYCPNERPSTRQGPCRFHATQCTLIGLSRVCPSSRFFVVYSPLNLMEAPTSSSLEASHAIPVWVLELSCLFVDLILILILMLMALSL
ncbi:hypothetical protein HanPSC8_Chr02g0063481 [Helianthus annuus]|nr:hypothetical protein HanPSC8_Chr02g0063481 [Helianthus annuus]